MRINGHDDPADMAALGGVANSPMTKGGGAADSVAYLALDPILIADAVLPAIGRPRAALASGIPVWATGEKRLLRGVRSSVSRRFDMYLSSK